MFDNEKSPTTLKSLDNEYIQRLLNARLEAQGRIYQFYGENAGTSDELRAVLTDGINHGKMLIGLLEHILRERGVK